MQYFGEGPYSIVITWEIDRSQTQYCYKTTAERDAAYKRHKGSSKTANVVKKG
jgi:hypothetical protein